MNIKDVKANLAIYKQFDVAVEPVEDRRVRFTITTSAPDREMDVVTPKGVDTEAYLRNPVVLFGHDYKSLPVGKCVGMDRYDDKIVATVEFATADLNPMADQVYRMVKAGFLKAASIGFRPMPGGFEYNEERKGIDFAKTELLEFSIVPVPANAQALVAAGAAGIDVAVLKSWAAKVIAMAAEVPEKMKPNADGTCPDGYEMGEDGMCHMPTMAAEIETKPKVKPDADGKCPSGYEMGDDGMCHMPYKSDPIRWNRQLSKAFDVDEAPLTPKTREYEWASRYTKTPLKDVWETTVEVCGARMGSFLAALDDSLAPYQVDAVRNITHHGEEAPPVYETMQLNSTTSRTFLVEGLRFVRGPATMVVKVGPSWSGIAVTVLIARAGSEHAVDFLLETSQKARQYKFLKGEAFSLSGEFIPRDGTTTLDGVFLEARNIEPVRRVVKVINERGADMESRGMILMGPPGTGKTLVARAMMNEAKDATYVWVSARDLYRSGSFEGISMAYDLARENAPSVVVLEDTDSSMDGWVVDLLKSELDGVQQRTGIVTLLTTNFPQQLPKALIDRPGRFHDVLQFDLPGESIRRRMLDAWAPDAPESVRAATAKGTDGFSGAHLRELVRFAGTLQSQDGVEVGVALAQALEKVKSQRALIDQLQVGRTQWRSVAAVTKALYKGGRGTCDRCGGEDETLCVGVCARCVDALHPLNANAAESRIASMESAQVRALALGESLPPVFAKDAAAWKAFASERDRARKHGDLSNEVLSGMLAAWGFEAEAKALAPVDRVDVHALLKAHGLVSLTQAEHDEYASLKAGRVLSKANENKIRSAVEMLSDVLRTVEPEDPGAPQEAVLVLGDEPQEPEFALMLSESAPDPDAIVVDEAMLASIIGKELSVLVQRETRAVLNGMRGRID